MGIHPDDYQQDLDIVSLRGNLQSLVDVERWIRDTIQPGQYKLIFWDALYRFAVEGVSENDNSAMATFYNRMDRIAAWTNAANVLIHHASKGDQSGKRVTDVGAGAGAQSRAADCHLILREHETPGIAVCWRQRYAASHQWSHSLYAGTSRFGCQSWKRTQGC